jgi:alanyl-tRNA synthetase
VTERLYYTDPYVRDFNAQVIDSAGNRVYLDRTAFYPASGGQPFDTGTLGASRVVEVIDEEDRIAHLIEGDPPSGRITGCIDWDRRFDHMQQHSGQHLLSAVLHELFNVPTVSFHLGPDYSTIDVESPSIDERQLEQAQDRANAIVFENRPIQITFEQQSVELGLRKASEREGVLRIISIEGIDRSACGGTHVRSTCDIGPVQIRKLERIRGNLRIEFLCGWRAIRRARADYAALAEAAKMFSSRLDEVPQMVNVALNKAQELEKARKKISIELAQFRGRELYGTATPSADGFRRVEQRIELGDDARAIAAAFTGGEKAVYLAVSDNPPALLLAASKDSGLNAGEIVKAAVTAQGGRGGGNAVMAQGSVPSREALDRALAEIQSRAMIAAR